jgi:hypothetical protein
MDFEDDDKGVYELVEELKNQAEEAADDMETDPNAADKEGKAARRKGVLAKLKRVPRIVGSVDHAIMPMAPVSCFLHFLFGERQDVDLFLVLDLFFPTSNSWAAFC